jgi:hypothetical protein
MKVLRQFCISIVILFWCVGICLAGSTTSSGLSAQIFIDRVRADLNADVSEDSFYNDSDFVQWINEACQTIASLTGCMEETEEITLVTGAMSYAVSTTHYDINHVIYDSGVTDSPTRNYFLARFVPGINVPVQEPRPKLWWEWQNKIFVFPTPNSAISGTTLIASLIGTHPAVSTASSLVTIPAYLDTAIIYYVKAKAYFRERSEEKATYYLKLFNNLMAENKRIILHRDLSPTVSTEGAK